MNKPSDTSTTTPPVKAYPHVVRGSETYPEALLRLGDAPSALFVRGTLPDPALPHLAVVGTRRASPYGIQVTRMLIEPLARIGTVVVSGLAYGIDAEAHRAALDAGGTTVAVQGCGIDRVYPTAHTTLAQQIVEGGGAVLTEYAPGTPPLPHHFPARNRIVAGLSQAVLVVEAPERSGALITAYGALEIGCEVLAVPGPITAPTSAGCNALIARGARLVRSVEDVLDALQLDTALASRQNHATVFSNGSEGARSVLTALGSESQTLAALTERTGLPTAETLAAITELELAGSIRALPDGRYASTQLTNTFNAQPRNRRVADQGEED